MFLGTFFKLLPDDMLTVIMSFYSIQYVEVLRYLNKRFSKAALPILPLWVGVMPDTFIGEWDDVYFEMYEQAHMYEYLKDALKQFKRFRQLHPGRWLEIRITDSEQYRTGYADKSDDADTKESYIGESEFADDWLSFRGLELDGENWDGLRIVTPQIDAVYNEQGYSVSVKGKVLTPYAFKDCSQLTSVSFPEDLTHIERAAFKRTNIIKVDLSGCALTIIGAHAFESCYNLVSVIFPPTLMEIHSEAFAECEQLTVVNLSFTQLKKMECSTFEGCSRLTSVYFPAGLEEIARYAFRDCHELVHLVLPIDLKKIGDHAFVRCGKLNNVIFPASLHTIEYAAFESCGFTSLVLPGELSIEHYAFNMGYHLKKVTLSNTTAIRRCAFSHCNMRKIHFSPNLRVIAPKAFEYCSLRSVDLSGTKISNIADKTFYRCRKLKSVGFPESLESIEAQAFVECEKLLSLTFPSALKSIGEKAFSRCHALATVSFPSGLASVGNHAFEYCTSLTRVKYPSSLVSIGNDVFYECSLVIEGIAINL